MHHLDDADPRAWQASASCKGLAAEIFYPIDDEQVAAAKQVCHECAVQDDCLEYAIAVREKDGVWGGATERERRSIIRRRRRAAAKARALAEAEESSLGAVAGGA